MTFSLWADSANSRPSASISLGIPDDAQVPCFFGPRPWNLVPGGTLVGFTIDENGGVLVHQSDDTGDSVYAEVQIESLVELEELADAFLHPQAPPSSNEAGFGAVRLSALVEQVYCPIIVGEKLRLAKWKDALAIFPTFDLRSQVERSLTGSWGFYKNQRVCWREVCKGIDPGDGRLFEWNERDIMVLGPSCNCPAASFEGRHLQMPTVHDLGVVLRLSAQGSVLFMIDVLRHSVEGNGIRKEIAEAESWNGWLGQKQIAAPNSRLRQIHHAIAFRHARASYLGKVARLTSVREPLQAAPTLYERRSAMIECLHNEMLLQVESLAQPLPFFVEYPYAQFTGSADSSQRIRHAQMLLNVLAKLPLLLPLEELHHAGGVSTELKDVVERLNGKPLTDGALLELGDELARIVAEKILMPKLPVFGGLVSETGARLRKALRPLVEARNRMHHHPFDEVGFLNVADRVFPEVIGQLRTVFCDFALVVPKQVRPTKNATIVYALMVMGENPAFKICEFTSQLPAGRFIVEELAAHRGGGSEAIVPLNFWLMAKTFSTASVDVGLFDRMEQGGPAFCFTAHA